MEAKIEPQSQKKTIRKSCFFYRPSDPKMEGKRVPKPAEMEANTVENRSQKRAQRKNEESMKTNNSPTFWLDFGCLQGWKIEEEIEKRVTKTIQNRRVILKRMSKGFLTIVGPFWTQVDQKSKKLKKIKNKTDVKTNVRERMRRSDPSDFVGRPPWSSSQYAPDRS